MATYLLTENQQTGPFSDEYICAAIADGTVSYENLAWREGLPDWQPLRTLYPLAHSSPTLPVPAADQTQTGSNGTAAKTAKAIGGLFIVVVIGWGCIKGCSSRKSGFHGPVTPAQTPPVAVAPAQKSVAAADKPNISPRLATSSVTLGKALDADAYLQLRINKLESMMMFYGGAQTKVKVSYQLLYVKIYPEDDRLNLKPLDGSGIDVLVPMSSPLYDKIIDLDLQLYTKVTVWGTVRQYNNSSNSVHIDPDQLSFQFNK